jgi:hypothetical protein
VFQYPHTPPGLFSNNDFLSAGYQERRKRLNAVSKVDSLSRKVPA